ncbi:MAG: hypothetical protein O7A64_05560 [Alphaproteobacteria bacterium]|nr:hypothetical protein [Alphaproteobacteria bacterium]
MTKNRAEGACEHGHIEKVEPSESRRGNAVPLAAESKYDFHAHGTFRWSAFYEGAFTDDE